jgi:hypothetical protein
LAKDGIWEVSPDERPLGWEELGLGEPMTNEERLSGIARILSMNPDELRECLRDLMGIPADAPESRNAGGSSSPEGVRSAVIPNRRNAA